VSAALRDSVRHHHNIAHISRAAEGALLMTITDPARDLVASDLTAAWSTWQAGGPPTVAVLGLGYVGLPTALALHSAGLTVLGIDISPGRLTEVRMGRPDLLDSDLRRLDTARDDAHRFWVSDDLGALAGADCVLICVPTPIDARQNPDLEPLRAACSAVVREARPGQAFVLTSTTYVGCTRDMLVEPLAERGLIAGEDVFVCFAPERIDPANTTFAQTAVPKVVGGVTDACVAAVTPIL
jgi:UDP-N-acetyl-D-glucosamine dehydrogenase